MTPSTPEWAVAGRVIGLGIDAIEIGRIKGAIERRPRFVDRIFTEEEQDYCGRFSNPYSHWAVRFAGKEAVMKSLGVGPGRVGWRDISIPGPGKPVVALTGGAAERAELLGIGRVEISLSHTREMAYALAASLGADEHLEEGGRR